MNGGKSSYEHYYSKFLLRAFQGRAPGSRSNEGLVRIDYDETNFGYGMLKNVSASRDATPLPIRRVLGEIDFYSSASLYPEAESLLTDVEREASLGLADLQNRRPITARRYFAWSQYMRLLFVRSKPWVDANGLALFDSLVAKRPTDGVLFSVSLQRTSSMGRFISPNRPLGSQSLFPTSLYVPGEDGLPAHMTDLLAHAPTSRFEYSMMYAHPEQREDGFFLCETNVPIRMESVQSTYALIGASVAGRNSIYVHPADADQYRVLMEQKMTDRNFRQSMLDKSYQWAMQADTVETWYQRHGDTFMPQQTTKVRNVQNWRSVSQLRTLPFSPTMQKAFDPVGHASVTPEEWHRHWDSYTELSRALHRYRGTPRARIIRIG